MSDAASLHLKLDRVLAEMAGVSGRLDEHNEAIERLTAGLELLRQGQDDVRTAVETLAEAADQDGADGGELAASLLRMGNRLDQMVADSTRMVTVINGLPRAMSDAAMDAVRLALGEAIDPRPAPPTLETPTP